MRLRADVFIAALTRRVFAEGGYAAIERHGADAAGAIFVRARHRDGSESLYAPAPQAVFEDARDPGGESAGRLFEPRVLRASADQVDETLRRERDFDPDLWIVEIEVEAPEAYLDIIPV